MMRWQRILSLCAAPLMVGAFAPSPYYASTARTAGRVAESTVPSFDAEEGVTEKVEDKRNPDRPELPELKGDFDWDAKYAGDADWITENVPGKMVLNEVELAAQVTAMTKLEEKWRNERLDREYEAEQKVGWVAKAELLNGRTAMFFLVTGLLTELWTGESMPGQVEILLRVTGVIGFNG